MKRTLLFTLLIFLLISCKKNNDRLLHLDISFNIINRNINNEINELRLQNGKLVSNVNPGIVKDLNDSMIKYITYLDSIQSLCIGNQTPFFSKGERSEETKLTQDFIKKTNVFLSKLGHSIKSPFLKKRAYFLLNVNDIKLDEQSFIMYVECYFRNVSCEAFDFFINDRKRNLLAIQNDILYEALLEQCSNDE